MYIGKRFLIMLSIIVVWLIAVMAPIAYIYSLKPVDATNIWHMWDVVNAIFFMSPIAWLVLYFFVSQIQRNDDMNRLLRLEKMLRELKETELDQVRQRLSENPQAEAYESIEDLLAAQKSLKLEKEKHYVN
ncbi:MAG TPA: hypothetical protein VHL11_09750 [Phototrophicaceae bacterium]|jgi:hypothetical protein|nr:hypothetical protein [Phototrophicaceae bacterium]